MNTFIEGKLGEVLAFARVGQDTLERGHAGFIKMFDKSTIEDAMSELKQLEDSILALAGDEDATAKVEEGAGETAQKVTDMRDTYIDGNWSEASEVLEWMGFYTGASLVHWYLISGAGKSLKLKELQDMSRDAIEFYTSLFASDEKKLATIGASLSEK